jgi:wyosine [tRNA(Phe)-imidazoG37] synthetase (radical SAM superfamily)
VLDEIDLWLQDDGIADYITLSGSGEPTLHQDFGQVLDVVANQPIPSVLLTNGSTLYIPEVRRAAARADIVKISLSAWDQRSLEWINRPHPTIRFDRLLEGQHLFRRCFDGQLWVEVFLLLGINSMLETVKKIADRVKHLQPDRIHLNTVVRPPAEEFAGAPSCEHLTSLTALFDPPAEVIANFSSAQATTVNANAQTILAMLQRRPCTIDQIVDVFNLHISEVSKHLGALMQAHRIKAVNKEKSIYYVATKEKRNRHFETEFGI